VKLSALFLFFFIPAIAAYSQAGQGKKQGTAVYTLNAPAVDAGLGDKCWADANSFTGFRQYEPYSGKPSLLRTVVKVLYDNEGIYVGAMMYDHHPDSIRTELGPRDADRSIVADYFNIDLGPYNDDINGYSFKLTASGIQSDIRRSSGSGGRDLNWDAVWYSAVQVVDSGWTAEIKIPFSAIRFPAEGNHVWGVNFWRYIQRHGEWSSWNYADKSHGTTINYLGELNGISGIKPPPRISLTPYLSVHSEKSAATRNNAFHGGADLKVGMGKAFTLDATLIPDFGQVQSDDQVLNLSPYEVKYNERRQFFTEGTDVFNKGGIFYSRRIGAAPSGYTGVYDSLGEDEEVISNPTGTRLINATKISGRTKQGLGIGFFNGITARASAELRDINTGQTREIITQPLTNYNMLVIDQNLGGGSYISLANTSVINSPGSAAAEYNANVTAADMRYLSPNRNYSASAVSAISQKYYTGADNIFGHSLAFSAGKTGGNFRLYYSHTSRTDDYDPNDMGYLRRNNEFSNSVNIAYNIYEPRAKILYSLNTISFSHEMLHSPRRFSSFTIRLKSSTTFKNFTALSLSSSFKPSGENDHYEPRRAGRFYRRPPSAGISADLSSDERKTLSMKISAEYLDFYTVRGRHSYTLTLAPSVRLNNKFNLAHSFSYRQYNNDTGYAGQMESVIFGRRSSGTIENIFSLNYIYSAKAYFSTRVRHYWSGADYDSYYVLNEDGSLGERAEEMNRDININYFNIDMMYTWRFAPGSELRVAWKNSISQSGSEIFGSFGENIDALIQSPSVNNISLKILYYLDYHSLAGS